MENLHIITGGSSGIGLACAETLAQQGGLVLLAGRGEEKLQTAAAALRKKGLRAEIQPCDIAQKSSVQALFDRARALGRIRSVVNSAGVSGVGHDAKTTFAIDLLGAEHLLLGAREALDKGGVLILIASMMGHMVPPNAQLDALLVSPGAPGALEAFERASGGKSDIAYNIAKRGVRLMARHYAKEFGERGLRILSVSPGIIMTPMAKAASDAHPEVMRKMEAMTPAGRNGKPEDIAEAVAFLASDRASFITGTDLLIDGGLSIRLPELAAASR